MSDDLRIPTGIEPLVGVRIWALAPPLAVRSWGANFFIDQSSRPSRIYPMVANDPAIWKTAKGNVAQCAERIPGAKYNFDSHNIIDDDCGCGIYARKHHEWDESWHMFEPFYSGTGTRMITVPYAIMGEVALSGRIVEGTRGYRAEKADIKCFYRMPGFHTEGWESLAEAYDVPLIDPPSWYKNPYTRNLTSDTISQAMSILYTKGLLNQHITVDVTKIFKDEEI